MADINLSKQLGSKLGEDKVHEINEIKGLIDFFPRLEELMDYNSCSESMRNNVCNKMMNITEILVGINKINSMHISNNKKKEKIEEILKDFSLEDFKKELYSEIGSTNKVMQNKIKDIAKKLVEYVQEKGQVLKTTINDSKETVLKQIEQLKEKEEKLKREAKDRDNFIDVPEENIERVPEEKSLTVKSNSFFETFKNLWKDRNKDKENKKGFFSILRDTYNEFKLSEDEKKEVQKETDKAYKEQVKTKNDIDKLKDDLEKLTQQSKELAKEVANIGKKALDKTKEIYDQKSKVVKEVVPEKLKELSEKISNMGHGMGDKTKIWKDRMINVIDTVFEYTTKPVFNAFGANSKSNENDKDKRNKGMDR